MIEDIGLAIISSYNLSKTYTDGFAGRKKIIALSKLNLQIEEGEVFGIVGPNGAGKSTTLKLLMGFLRPDSGQAVLAGKSAESHHCHSQIGYLPENPSLYHHLTITEHLQFADRLTQSSRHKSKKRIEKILHIVDLEHAAKTPISRFSKGMKQRAGLAYALFLKPKILILDEPMSGLDPVGRQLVVDIIRLYHRQGSTILFCSHILSDVERICSRIGVMHKGKLAAITTPSELLQSNSNARPDMTALEAFFLDIIAEKNTH